MTHLPPEIAQREQTTGQFTAVLAEHLPEDLRTPVAFCGPASFREPEIDNCWHPYMIKRGVILFFLDQLPRLARAWVSGIIRFARGRFGNVFVFPQAEADVIGVAPVSLCRVVGDKVETIYCHADDVRAMSWIILDDAVSDPRGYPVSRAMILMQCARVLRQWFSITMQIRQWSAHWVAASIITLRWILSLQWVTQWMWALRLRARLATISAVKVHAVHEVWPWARVVWYEAARLGIRTSTIQHASIVRNKLWYFPVREEREAGMALPNEFFVFSEKNKELLRPFYPETQFMVNCGPRYAHWKERIATALPDPSKMAPILFVSSIPWWDNEVVLQALQRVMKEESGRPIRVRLHPHSAVSQGWKRWLTRMDAKGTLTVSEIQFQEDIINAGAVVGMNTTILEEAVAMGRAAIVLTTERYLSFGTHLGFHIPLLEISRERIEQSIVQAGSRRDTLVAQGREALGLDQPVARIAL